MGANIDLPAPTIGLPPELMNVPLPRKLPVAHQVLVIGLRGRTVLEGRSISADQAACPFTINGLRSLRYDESPVHSQMARRELSHTLSKMMALVSETTTICWALTPVVLMNGTVSC